MDSYFYLFIKLLSAFFLFYVKMQTKQDQTAIIGHNLYKLTQYKTQDGESNYVDHKFFFNFYQELPTCTKPWGQTSKYYRAA